MCVCHLEMMMMGFVTKQVIPSMQLCDVRFSELTEQMETPWISFHKHTDGRCHSSFSHCWTEQYAANKKRQTGREEIERQTHHRNRKKHRGTFFQLPLF